MFYAGMEMDPKELLEHIWPSTITALGGIILPFLLGFGTVQLFGGTIMQSLFIGLGISISALAVQAVILQSMRINRTEIGHIIIGAAIVDNILALVGLAVLLGLARSGTVDIGSIAWILSKVFLFFGLTILIGHYLMPILTSRLTDKAAKGFTFAITVALAMAFLAELAGLHLIIGAFLGGQFVRKEIMDEKIYEAIADRFYGMSYGFLVPIFFVSLSFHLHPTWSWSFIIFCLVLTLVATIGKVFGCGLAVKLLGYNNREASVVGFGMNGRGAVELAVALVVVALSQELLAAGTIKAPLLTNDQFSALILVAFITTLIAPLTLKWTVTNTCLPDEKADFCRMMDEVPPR